MEFKLNDNGNAIEVAMTGAWCFDDHPSFRVMLRTLRESRALDFTLDCSGVTGIEAAGLGMLSMVEDMADTKGATLRLVRVQGEMADFLATAKFTRFLEASH